MKTSEAREDIASYYDEYSTWYEGERREGYYGLINDLEVEALTPFATDADVLELGCGTGLILERTTALARRAVSIDLSIGMAKFSHKKGLTATNASATALPFPDDSFDLVYSCKVLPHVPDIATAMLEVDRVLRPGGVAMVEFYNPRSFKALTYKIQTIRRSGIEPVYVRHDTVDDVASFLPAGWEVESVRGIRIFGPIRQAYTLPVLGGLLERLERAFCDRSFGRLFGGYILVKAVRSS